ncbi:hypothetical protein PACTADRAFT_51607 [Pachysolen tannophilus NRRL Y-2460]|uniref:Uncharacterized protein n=1 Tax=Pachysolen tannophilus NRRL Y-2460 TaxID=669874 RepID=A0A1E4TQA5_PACTA|nr:hypothetical protein PACTADRAFT_51607 [Pachysolen tannophilus NRRL Y-2460]
MSELSTPLEQTPDPDSKQNGVSVQPAQKKRKGGAQPGVKVSAEILAKRREGRLKAMATIQSQIEKSGIKRMDTENNLPISNFQQIPLINQKNYYTDYLKKDDQITLLRNIKEVNFNLNQAKKTNRVKQSSVTNTATPDVNTMADDDEVDDDDDDEEDDENNTSEKVRAGSDVIVIHPGSTSIRIGLSTDVYPKVWKNVIAYRKTSENNDLFEENDKVSPSRIIDNEQSIIINDEEFHKHKKTILANFKERMRYYKRRILPNSNETCFNFNKRQVPEQIAEHNDIHKFEFLNSEELYNDENVHYIVGADALRLDNYDKWYLRSPLKSGTFNDTDPLYKSTQEVLGDLEIIITNALSKEFNITKKNSNNYKIVLIVPNLYEKTYVENMTTLFLHNLNFSKIAVLQEGISATFGSGISLGCIVDIGSHTTTISCIDEGMILNNSQITLNYGGDDITKVFIKLLLEAQFPYTSINLNDVNDFRLANELKEKFITFQDADIAIQIYNFMVRKPNKLTEKYEFKVFDEVMISAMGLFYPDIFKPTALEDGINGGNMHKHLFPEHIDYFSGKYDDPISLGQVNLVKNEPLGYMSDKDVLSYFAESDIANKSTNGNSNPRNASNHISRDAKNFTPLDIAIIESITQCSYADSSKLKKLYENILIVGGSSKISGFDNLLYDRLNIWRSKLLSCTNLGEIFRIIEQERQSFEESQKDKEEKEPFKITKNLLTKVNDVVEESNILPVGILSSSRDIDPEILCWKGGSVYGRLKVVNEMWVDEKEWDLMGTRCFQYKSMFNF